MRHQRSSEVLRGHHASSCVIRGHQRPSEVISGHQRSSEVIRGHHASSCVIRGHHLHGRRDVSARDSAERRCTQSAVGRGGCAVVSTGMQRRCTQSADEGGHQHAIRALHTERWHRAASLRRRAFRGHQKPSVVIRGHQRSSEVIRGHQAAQRERRRRVMRRGEHLQLQSEVIHTWHRGASRRRRARRSGADGLHGTRGARGSARGRCRACRRGLTKPQ